MIFPKPEELKTRAEKRFKEMGKEVPPEVVGEMLGIHLFQILKSYFFFVLSIVANS